MSGNTQDGRNDKDKFLNATYSRKRNKMEAAVDEPKETDENGK
jgi:hypothetical protein